MARRAVGTTPEPERVTYADREPSAFASMLGGLIDANVRADPRKQADFERLVARVGIWVTDIDEGVTLDFKGGSLVMHNGLKPTRTITRPPVTATVRRPARSIPARLTTGRLRRLARRVSQPKRPARSTIAVTPATSNMGVLLRRGPIRIAIGCSEK